MISLQHVNFIRNDRTILNNINLEIKPGEHWVLLGKNGSGKTTILELMNGYEFPSSGTVVVLGEKYGTVDVREMRKSIGYISQSLMEKLTLRDPVWEVVATGEYAFLRFYQEIPPHVVKKAIGWLERLQIAYLKDQPLGTLSQGERKKVLLARALMAEPKLLIMDEPCSGLDLFERERLLASIQDLESEGIGFVYVTHHIEEIIPLFTHVALIEQGQIVAAGNKNEVLTPGNLKEAFHVSLEVNWHHERPWIQVAESLQGENRLHLQQKKG